MKKVCLMFLMICILVTSSLVYAAPVSNNTARPEISVLFDTPTIEKEGQILEATISVKNIKDLASFQINLEYDPRMLQPIHEDGTPYDSNTHLKGGTIIVSGVYGVVQSASHQLDKDI